MSSHPSNEPTSVTQRIHPAILIALILLSVVAGLIYFAPVLLFKIGERIGTFQIQTFDEEVSPDGKWIAAAYTVRAGFVGDANVFVNIRRNGTDLNHWRGHRVVLGFFLAGVDLHWLNSHELLVSFDTSEPSQDQLPVKRTNVDGIKIDYRFDVKPETTK